MSQVKVESFLMTWPCLVMLAWPPLSPARWSGRLSGLLDALPGDKLLLRAAPGFSSFFQRETPGEFQFLGNRSFQFSDSQREGFFGSLFLLGQLQGCTRLCWILFTSLQPLLGTIDDSPHSFSTRSPGAPSPGAGAGLRCSQPLKRAAVILSARVEGLKRRLGTEIALFHKQSCFSLPRM